MTTTTTTPDPGRPTGASPSPFSATFEEQLRTAEDIEHRLAEHWREYEAFNTRLQELKVAQHDLRGMAEGVRTARQTSHGLDAVIDSIVELNASRPVEVVAWRERIALLGRDAMGEIMINVARHSQATSADASVKRASEWLLMVVTDNGRGGAHSEGQGGLAALDARVRAVGGVFSIESPEGGGTSITVCLPLNPPAPRS